MAYMSKEHKNELAPEIKAALKKYGLKGSISIDNRSTLVLTIKSGIIDYEENYKARTKFSGQLSSCMRINPYGYTKQFTGIALESLKELFAVLNKDNYDNSDVMTDYFDIGWYANITLGSWTYRYKCIKEPEKTHETHFDPYL